MLTLHQRAVTLNFIGAETTGVWPHPQFICFFICTYYIHILYIIIYIYIYICFTSLTPVVHKSPCPLCTHLLEKVDMGNKKQCFSLSNNIAIFSFLTMLGRKFCCKFSPYPSFPSQFLLQPAGLLQRNASLSCPAPTLHDTLNSYNRPHHPEFDVHRPKIVRKPTETIDS